MRIQDQLRLHCGSMSQKSFLLQLDDGGDNNCLRVLIAAVTISEADLG